VWTTGALLAPFFLKRTAALLLTDAMKILVRLLERGLVTMIASQNPGISLESRSSRTSCHIWYVCAVRQTGKDDFRIAQ
jgi:hypothetical protein